MNYYYSKNRNICNHTNNNHKHHNTTVNSKLSNLQKLHLIYLKLKQDSFKKNNKGKTKAQIKYSHQVSLSSKLKFYKHKLLQKYITNLNIG